MISNKSVTIRVFLTLYSPFRLVVRTSPFHGENMGSIPVRDKVFLLCNYLSTKYTVKKKPIKQINFHNLKWCSIL